MIQCQQCGAEYPVAPKRCSCGNRSFQTDKAIGEDKDDGICHWEHNGRRCNKRGVHTGYGISLPDKKTPFYCYWHEPAKGKAFNDHISDWLENAQIPPYPQVDLLVHEIGLDEAMAELNAWKATYMRDPKKRAIEATASRRTMNKI